MMVYSWSLFEDFSVLQVKLWCIPYPSILQYISVFTQIKIAKHEDLKDLKPNKKLGGGFKYSSFSLYLGKSPILTNIFQLGWNQHLALNPKP